MKKDIIAVDDAVINWDSLRNKFVDVSKFKELNELDRKYLYIKTGTTYISTLNSIEMMLKEMELIIKNLIPDSLENVKILMSRIADIDKNHIDDLSSDFIDKIFTINDKNVIVTFPEVGDFNDVEFKRLIIKEIKILNEQSVTAVSIRDEFRKHFAEDIPDDIKKLLTDVEAMDDWVLDYYSKKVKEPETTKEDKESFEKAIKVINDSYTLQPIIDDLNKSISVRGKEKTFKSFYDNRDKIVTSAINICSRHKLSVPFFKFAGIEELLLGEELDDKNKGFFIYCFARYIKNNKDDMTQEKQMFIASLSSHLILICIHKRNEKIKKTFERIKNSVKALIDIITDNKKG